MKVCLSNDSFPPLIDGVANTVVNYATVIQRKYGSALVATPKYPGVKDDYPFTVLRYPSINTVKMVGYRTGNPFDAIAIYCTVTALWRLCFSRASCATSPVRR